MDWIEQIKGSAEKSGIVLSNDECILLSSSTEDYMGLYEAEWEIRGSCPTLNDEEVEKRAFEAISGLLQKDLIAIYVDEWCEGGSFNGSEKLISKDKAEQLIKVREAWSPWSWQNGATQYAFSATQDEKVFAAEK